jgi:hypothetical protein
MQIQQYVYLRLGNTISSFGLYSTHLHTYFLCLICIYKGGREKIKELTEVKIKKVAYIVSGDFNSKKVTKNYCTIVVFRYLRQIKNTLRRLTRVFLFGVKRVVGKFDDYLAKGCKFVL